MSGWLNDYCIVLRANTIDDPAATGYDESLVALAGVLPGIQIIGSIEADGNQRLISLVDSRLELNCVAVDSTVLANATPLYPDFGRHWHLLRSVLTPHPSRNASEWYMWVMGIFASGGSGSFVPRARFDPVTGLSVDDWFTQELTFPMQVVVDGSPTLSPKFEEGTASLEFKLIKALPE